jgi:ferredoxin
MGMRIVVDPEECNGHGRCAAVAPDLFELDDLGYTTLRDKEVPPELEEQARRAVLNCPERCISIVEEPAN